MQQDSGTTTLIYGSPSAAAASCDSLGLDCRLGGNRDQVSHTNNVRYLGHYYHSCYVSTLHCLWLAVHCASRSHVLIVSSICKRRNSTGTNLHFKLIIEVVSMYFHDSGKRKGRKWKQTYNCTLCPYIHTFDGLIFSKHFHNSIPGKWVNSLEK